MAAELLRAWCVHLFGTRVELQDESTSLTKKEKLFCPCRGYLDPHQLLEVSAHGKELQSSFSYHGCTQNICFIHIWHITSEICVLVLV